MKAILALILISILALTACESTTTPRACTEEAKLCPDGNAVGRSGPNCEFETCPMQTESIEYISKDVKQCENVGKPNCKDGFIAFSDDTGCGCKPNPTNTQLANPASTFCVEQGGKLEIKTNSDGGQYGDCTLSDGTVCEEWALFRGECGGLRHICTDEEKANKACTREYMPVCGDDEVTYGNKCSACASEKITLWTIGECKKESPATPPIVGNDRDEHGCIGSAGYTWCDSKKKCLRVWEEKCNDNATAPIVGNDRDSHGCIGSAGYSWCEAKQKCLRSWEESCTAAEPTKNYCTADMRGENIACTMDWRPVCGWFGESIQCIKYPCAQEFGNGCGACGDKNVAYWTDGNCPE